MYFVTPQRYRWLTLLIVSYFFYINIEPVFALLTAAISLSTYFFTRLIDGTNDEKKKNKYMVINIILILLPLFFYKYFNEINNSIFMFLDQFNVRWPLPKIKLLLPIGISYYTFMAIGYTIDVYSEEIKAEKNLGIVALFISFFPLILSGPIERANNMLPQFRSGKNPDYDMISSGAKLMLWGYFMKLVVADRTGIYINSIFENAEFHNGSSLIVATLLYPIQVYGDLGGYSLIAIGVSKILGINVMDNFRRPFFATSMSEFWRRWHISLISWLTDYLYTPLTFAFRKYKIWGIVIALMITFILSGLWHGASLAFLVWGVMQGVLLSIEALTNKKKLTFEKKFNLNNNRLYIIISIIITYILFATTEIFGRGTDINEAITIFHKMFTTSGNIFIGTSSIVIYMIFGITLLLLKDFTDEFYPNKFLLFESKYKIVRIVSFSFVFILILLIGVLDGSQFIYFQF
ncbi:MBOAT family O-acyltransferase [Aureibaculum luteum]|uniref:MBOAT family O-acyltransferase n=1 Tax=Aureibaculum luteum TaxID=1548456 RepID=UPI001E2954DB|nr:MBOAT family O-acyltransferase [Aureibaculum luteum]